MYATMRFRVEKGRSIPAPQYRTAPGPLTPTRRLRRVLRHHRRRRRPLRGRPGRDPGDDRPPRRRATASRAEDAYLLCSLVVDLKISEIVDAGQYVVSRRVLPESIFLQRSRYEPLATARLAGRAWRSGRPRRRPGRRPASITATATFGFEAGAKATNQAVVFFAFWAMSAVETSSAVPVLPATVTPGIAAARPVPPRTTATIMSRTWPATLALTDALARALALPASQGLTRTPWLAIVAADRGHLERGGVVACPGRSRWRRRRGCRLQVLGLRDRARPSPRGPRAAR